MMAAFPVRLSDDDRAFLDRVEAGEVAGDAFRHRDHLRLAWCAIGAGGLDEALVRVSGALRRFAARLGSSGKYHETLTRCWIRLVASAMADTPEASFDRFLDLHPELRDTALPRRYYTEALLASAAARTSDCEPDRAPLP